MSGKNPIYTRKIPPQSSAKKNPGPARQRYLQRRSRRGRTGTFRALLGWFMMGMVGASIFVAILTPVVIRSAPPRYLARLSHTPLQFLQCINPHYCNEAEALPTMESSIDVAALIGQTNTPDGIVILPVVTATQESDWVVSTAPPPLEPTVQPSPTAVAMNPADTSPDPSPTPLIPPTAIPTPVAVAAAGTGDMPYESYLGGFRHIPQTWNNCGPATLTMGLNYWGWTGNQQIAASALKPEPEDKNVTPGQMVEFINAQIPGLSAVHRYAGSVTLIKRLILAGYPVLIETGFQPDGEEWMGHYRLIVGYSDLEGSFYIFDSYLGDGEEHEGRIESYEAVDRDWQHFNRVYVVVYPTGQEAQVANVLGGDWDPTTNAQHALELARHEASMDPGSPYTWFNLGTSFVLMGQYEDAATAYDQAFFIGPPWRMLWYQFGPYEAYLNADPPRLSDIEALVQVNLNNTPYLEETYYYQGMVYLLRGDNDEAVESFRQALQHNHNFTPATQALAQLQ